MFGFRRQRAHQPDGMGRHARASDQCKALYLSLLKRSLVGLTYEDASNLYPVEIGEESQRASHDATRRIQGADWPLVAPTMIGVARIENIQRCIERVLEEGIPGDVMETGVWRGGAVIFMRGVLKAYGVRDRKVWAADSFEGLPPPNIGKYPQDAGLNLDQYRELAVSLEEVQQNFERYELLDDQVGFLKGWFRDTLPRAPIERLALLRLDGDLYESTMDALTHLYGRVSAGGYVIIDDFNIASCRQAVHDFREARGLRDPIERIDWAGVFWRRSR